MAVSSDNLCEGQHTRYTFPWTTGRGPIMSGVPSIQAKPIYDMDEKGPKGALFLGTSNAIHPTKPNFYLQWQPNLSRRSFYSSTLYSIVTDAF